MGKGCETEQEVLGWLLCVHSRATGILQLASLSSVRSQPSSWRIPSFCQVDQIQDIQEIATISLLSELSMSWASAQGSLGSDQGKVWVQ